MGGRGRGAIGHRALRRRCLTKCLQVAPRQRPSRSAGLEVSEFVLEFLARFAVRARTFAARFSEQLVDVAGVNRCVPALEGLGRLLADVLAVLDQHSVRE